jgi:hypothetical protein
MIPDLIYAMLPLDDSPAAVNGGLSPALSGFAFFFYAVIPKACSSARFIAASGAGWPVHISKPIVP